MSGGGLPGWGIALIVIACVAVVGVAGYFVYTKVLQKKVPNRESETEKSLLEREGELDNKDSDDDSSEGSGSSGSGSSGYSGEAAPLKKGDSKPEEPEEEKQEEPEPVSLNRETVTSV